MNALNNPLAWAFFDDMADIGAFNWLKGVMLCGILGYGLDGIIPYAWIIGIVLAINLLVAAGVSYWWDRIGREKYATSDIVDIAEAVKTREKE